MAQQAPGKAFRKGISFTELFRKFPDEATSEAWFAEERWGNSLVCPHCGSLNAQSGAAHKTMPYRCREKECRKRFSVKTGTAMQASNLGYQTWATAIYLVTTSLKGVSSMKLHRDLNITQKTAWHLCHRIRKAFELNAPSVRMGGPVEVDEAAFGGREGNKHANRKLNAGRGTVGKSIVAGIKSRETNEIRARVVPDTTRATLAGFVESHIAEGAMVYSDEAAAYARLPRHEAISHGAGEYVRQQAHINGVESFWSTMKRAHKGVFHKLSPKHLGRYVDEFSGRHNLRCADTLEQMGVIVRGLEGKRLMYHKLIEDNGLSTRARA